MDRRYSPRFISRQDRVLAGVKRVVTIANPAAGTDFSVQVPGGRQWRIDSLAATFTASAVVANRVFRLILSDGTNVFWRGGISSAITANQQVPVGGSVLGPQGSNNGSQFPALVSLPDLVLPSETVFAGASFGLDVGDQWSGVALLVEEFWNSDQSLTNRHLAYDAAEDAAAQAALAQIGGV